MTDPVANNLEISGRMEEKLVNRNEVLWLLDCRILGEGFCIICDLGMGDSETKERRKGRSMRHKQVTYRC